jgi:L-threonylcarbamoyladenylate synthase
MSTSTRATAPKRRLTARRRLSSAQLAALVEGLRAGHLAIFPTETVYGLGASVFAPSALRRIYHLKGRASRKPLALLVHHLRAAAPLIESIPVEAIRLAERFWPGPLTLVFKASALGRLVMGGLQTVGVRIPAHPLALQLLEAIGVPLATTSVNRSGDDPAVSAPAAAKRFGAAVEWLLDGGPCRVKEPSSVVDVSSYPFTVIREGAIAKKALEEVLFGPLPGRQGPPLRRSSARKRN